MSQQKRSSRLTGGPREGAMLVLVLGLLVVILAMVVYTVDVAFMQLARTELHAATDAAAKAAAGELAATDGDSNLAITAGKLISMQNEVAGAPLQLVSQDFEFGQSIEQSNGTWRFVPNTTPYTSVRVTASKSTTSKSGPVNLFFAPLFGADAFTPQHVAVASQFQQELMLVIDRSHSMTFDESGVEWSYPAGIPSGDYDQDGDLDGVDALVSPPHPSQSRWAKLTAAIDSFLYTVSNVNVPPRVGLVTWASTLSASSNETVLTGITWNAVEVDVPLGGSYTNVSQSIHDRGQRAVCGATNLAAGIDAAADRLVTNGTSTAKKSMIVMTDGQWNRGRNPVDAAIDAKADGITIYTITFLDVSDQTTMMEVAEKTGGRHYHASNSEDLQAIFDELARTLPVALTY